MEEGSWQIKVCLRHAGTCSKEVAGLVQKGAPNELLFGTDTQSSLGFFLTLERGGERIILMGKVESGGQDKPAGGVPLLPGESAGAEGGSNKSEAGGQDRPTKEVTLLPASQLQLRREATKDQWQPPRIQLSQCQLVYSQAACMQAKRVACSLWKNGEGQRLEV